MVTAATYNNVSNRILLTGYTITTTFIIELDNFSNPLFSNGTINRYEIQTPSGYSGQVEAITYIDNNDYYVTSEKGMMGQNAGLYKFTGSILGTMNHEKTRSVIYPNPAKDLIEIISEKFYSVEVYDLKGTLLRHSTTKKMNISSLSAGIYLLKINYQKRNSFTFQKLIIE